MWPIFIRTRVRVGSRKLLWATVIGLCIVVSKVNINKSRFKAPLAKTLTGNKHFLVAHGTHYILLQAQALQNKQFCVEPKHCYPNRCNQCLGRFSGIISQSPSVSKSNQQLHVVIIRVFFINWRYIPQIPLK